MHFKSLILNCCPPVLLKIYRSLRRKDSVSFSGNYDTWLDAESHSIGYDSENIIKRVLDASLKVKRGEAVFERDSVCFYKEEYRWPTLSCFLSIAAEHDGKLNVLDFGGALGSFYFQHKKFFSRLNKVSWSVIEQEHFVDCGKRELQTEELKFYFNIEEFLSKEKVDVIFLSGVLQCLENPESMFMALSEIKADYILFDRTPIIEAAKDRLTVQSVPESIYKASYPAWFFSKSKFHELIIKTGYKIVVEFDADDDVGIGKFKGYLLERN
jgi:putative methyltransferase (TIGR04325 family)